MEIRTSGGRVRAGDTEWLRGRVPFNDTRRDLEWLRAFPRLTTPRLGRQSQPAHGPRRGWPS
ncbi:hypothetical protein [Streptomyces sp. 7N604]|uniref:hypothetical protein n=1 Tax=Streptomyces sp. 7N604 TaxID=3457415 RepID=UPI003FD304A2